PGCWDCWGSDGGRRKRGRRVAGRGGNFG
nr:hypothetical protein [Tanacetum cinerariifolium]